MASTIRGNDNFDSANANIALQTAIATTSGTSHDFTGIPAGVKRITVMFNGVSTNGTSNPLIQLGDSGGVEVTGYLGCSFDSAAISNYTTGFGIRMATTSGVLHGVVTLSLVDSTTNTWVAHGVIARSDGLGWHSTGGTKPLSATLDRIRLTTVNGIDTFDAGSVNISYEY